MSSTARRVGGGSIRLRVLAVLVVSAVLGAGQAVGALAPSPVSAQAAGADLAVTVSHSPSVIQTGDEVTFTVTASNAGPATAAEVAVGFSYGYSWQYVSTSDVCGLNGEASAVICPLGSIRAGSSATVTVTAIPLLSGVQVLPAVVVSATPDPDDDDRSDTTTVLVHRGPSMPERIVTEIYRNVLGREPSAGEVEYWAGRVDATYWGQSNEVPRAIIASPESARRRVAASYDVLLDRPASPDDLAYWTDRLVGGMQFQTFEAYVIGSAEFARHHGPEADLVIDATYQHVVGRGPSSAELIAWMDALDAGADTTSLTMQLQRTNAARNKFLAARLQELLGRDPHDFDRLVWFSALDAGATLDDLWADLFSNGEFLQQFPFDYG